MKNKHCSKLLRDICDFLGGDLDSPPCRSIREHLKECKNCEIYVDKLKKTVTLYRRVAGDVKVPERLNRKLFAKISLMRGENEPHDKA